MSTAQPAPLAPDRYTVRRVAPAVRGSAHSVEYTGTVIEVADGRVWFLYDGEARATPYERDAWDAMVAEGVAVRVGSVVP